MEANHILKFKKIDKFLIDSLVHSHLYFAKPEDLNDPFDCSVDIEKSLKEAISQSSGSERSTIQSILSNDELQKLFNQAQQEIKNYGVFSGSHSPALRSSLMWSHYADSHRGVCLIYAIPTNPIIFFNSNKIIAIQSVKYGTNQLTNWFLKLPVNESIHNKAFEDMIKTVLTIKNICWEYEDEVRMIRKTSGIVLIDKFYLQHVCFGLATPENEITLIKEILINFKYDVALSRIQRTDSDFGIQAIEIRP